MHACIAKHKGHDLVVAVLPLLNKEVHLLIAGGTRIKEDMAYYEELKRLAQRHHCIDRITFHDHFPITPIIMNVTDIAILPYRHASESLVLRLLIAYKVPTITSDVNVFKEIKQEYVAFLRAKRPNQIEGARRQGRAKMIRLVALAVGVFAEWTVWHFLTREK